MGLIVGSGDSSASFASGSGCTKFGDTKDDIHQMTGSFMIQADVSNNYATIIDNDESSSGHGLKVTSDGNGSGTYLFDVESQSTTVLRVRGDGRVGIGVTSPGSTLSVDDEIAVGEKLIHRGDPDTYIQFPGQNQIILAANGYAFLTYDGDIKINNATRDRDTQILADDGNVVLHVDAGDNRVGIGTTSPTTTLDVDGVCNATTLSIGSTSIGATATELNMLDADSTSPSDAPFAIVERICKATMDSNDYSVGVHGLGVTLPDNAIITNGYMDITTGLASLGGTAEVTITVTDGSTTITCFPSTMAAIFAAGVSRIWTPGAAISGQTTAPVKLTAASEVTFTVEGEALIRGAMDIYIHYIIGS